MRIIATSGFSIWDFSYCPPLLSLAFILSPVEKNFTLITGSKYSYYSQYDPTANSYSYKNQSFIVFFLIIWEIVALEIA